MLNVSLCMIVKNEEKTLARCLDSIQGHVNEIIIVDTGSTDRTKEIAAGYDKVVLLNFPWCDDFSAARNVSIEAATGEWLFYMDADEVFTGEFPKQLDPAIYNFTIENLSDNGNVVVSNCSRLIPNDAGVKFVGRVHETLHHPDKDFPVRHFETGKIRHDGYTTAARDEKQKNERNMRLLKMEYEREKNAQTCFYYAQELNIQGNKGAALMVAKEGLREVDKTSRLELTFVPLLQHVLISCLCDLNRHPDIREFENKHLPGCEYPEVFLVLCQYYAKIGHEGSMLKYATQVAKFANMAALPIKYVESNVLFAPYLIVGDWYAKKDDKLSALYWYELAHGSGMDNVDLLAKIHSLLPKVPRNCQKWEYYCKRLFELTRNTLFLKDLGNCYLNDPDEEKHVVAINMLNSLLTAEEKEKLAVALDRNRKGHLKELIKWEAEAVNE